MHEVRLDCDGDAVLVIVDQTGAACHTGDPTCFDADVLTRSWCGVTEELFATDAYRRSFDATITEVDREAGRVALARTAFYPGGGGQPHDLGTLDWGAGPAAVTRVKREGGRIWHWLDAPGAAR